ncbi:MAG: hypothetical protein U1F41_12760 [Burkholderiales bacterium]
MKNRSRLYLACAIALAAIGAPPLLAHTTVRSQATEGVTADNALRIGHGCSVPGSSATAVRAQSVVFPTSNPVVTTSDGSSAPKLEAVIASGSLAGLARFVEDTSVFNSQASKTDALGNSIGFAAWDGSLAPDLLGRIPFQFAAPKFVATSCAARLLVKVAIADVCSFGAGETATVGKVNLWIPDNGSQYAVAGKASGVDGIGAPATLIVNRDLSTNPLPAACGAGIDVTVTPSAADVDANLAIRGVWGFGATAASQSVQVVEYYNTSLDHYFITWMPDEIAKLDDGTSIRGWQRTGRQFRTYTSTQAGTSPVCRYYIPPAKGDSHFFGRGTAECTQTGQNNPSFVLEDPQFMQMFLPAVGACPANTTQIYRVFSNRPDANHRYLTDKLTRAQMASRGWVVEGDGPDSVVMCAPL